METLISEAREAAREDRNRQAAELFAEVARRAPERRQEILREYADQLVYTDRAARAVPLYQEFLATAEAQEQRLEARRGLALALSWSDQLPLALREYETLLAAQPHDLQAHRGRARVLLWMDDVSRARAAYEEILLLNPADVEGRRGLAQAQSWSGRHRSAIRTLRPLLESSPDDVEARLILAHAQHWMGRPDRAAATLSGIEPSPGSLALTEDIRRASRPSSSGGVQQAGQSDDLIIFDLALRQRIPLMSGRSELSPFFTRQNYRPAQPSLPSVVVHRPGVAARHRISDDGELNLDGRLELINVTDGRSHRLVTGDAWVTAWPNDFLRIDVSANRFTFDNVRSLERGLTGSHAGLSADVLPNERMRFSLRSNRGRYSDGNRRSWNQVEARNRPGPWRNVWIGTEATRFSFSEQLDNGYFNPARFTSLTAFGEGWGDIARLHVALYGSYGREWVEPGEDKPIWSVRGSTAVRIAESLQAEVRYQKFSSLVTAGGGFARETLGIGLRYGW